MGKYKDIFKDAVPLNEYLNQPERPKVNLEGKKTLVRGDPKNAGRKEAEILKEILEYLKENKIWHRRIYTGGIIRGDKLTANTAKGFSDIIAVIGGKALFIEVKRPGGHLSCEQRLFLMTAKEAGAIGDVVTSVDDLKLVLSLCSML